MSISRNLDPDTVVPEPTFSSLDGVPTQSLVLVRSEGSLQSCRVNTNGDLVLSRKGSDQDSMVNTFHFSLNGLASSHANGKHDQAFVILSPLAKTCIEYDNKPSGLSGADTWFHADANSEMTILGAIVLAPFGSHVPSPLVHMVRFYPACENLSQQMINRNKALVEALHSMNAPAREIDAHGWVNIKRSSRDEFSKVASDLGVPNLLSCSHVNSPDEQLETAVSALRYAIADFDLGLRLYPHPAGHKLPLVDRCEALLSGILADANWHFEAIGDAKAFQFFSRHIKTLTPEVLRVRFLWELETGLNSNYGDIPDDQSTDGTAVGCCQMGGCLMGSGIMRGSVKIDDCLIGGCVAGGGASDSGLPPPLADFEYQQNVCWSSQ